MVGDTYKNTGRGGGGGGGYLRWSLGQKNTRGEPKTSKFGSSNFFAGTHTRTHNHWQSSRHVIHSNANLHQQLRAVRNESARAQPNQTI